MQKHDHYPDALAIKATNVQEALKFLRRAPQTDHCDYAATTELPDELRRKPRFDFSGDDYKQNSANSSRRSQEAKRTIWDTDAHGFHGFFALLSVFVRVHPCPDSF